MTRGYMPQAVTHEWETPEALFDALWDEFGGFDLDPCTRPQHHTALRVYASGGIIYVPTDEEERPPYQLRDGLTHPWRGKVYLNPPYGRGTQDWIEKAVACTEAGAASLVVALLPVRSDTRWWQRWVLRKVSRSPQQLGNDVWNGEAGIGGVYGPASEVRFLAGRLRFGGASGPAPFPSCVVVWRG